MDKIPNLEKLADLISVYPDIIIRRFVNSEYWETVDYFEVTEKDLKCFFTGYCSDIFIKFDGCENINGNIQQLFAIYRGVPSIFHRLDENKIDIPEWFWEKYCKKLNSDN